MGDHRRCATCFYDLDVAESGGDHHLTVGGLQAIKIAGSQSLKVGGDIAERMGIGEGELEEAYRQRSLLKRSVYPEDIAEAVLFFASELSAKSTGNSLNVDAGNQVAFGR